MSRQWGPGSSKEQGVCTPRQVISTTAACHPRERLKFCIEQCLFGDLGGSAGHMFDGLARTGQMGPGQ